MNDPTHCLLDAVECLLEVAGQKPPGHASHHLVQQLLDYVDQETGGNGAGPDDGVDNLERAPVLRPVVQPVRVAALPRIRTGDVPDHWGMRHPTDTHTRHAAADMLSVATQISNHQQHTHDRAARVVSQQIHYAGFSGVGPDRLRDCMAWSVPPNNNPCGCDRCQTGHGGPDTPPEPGATVAWVSTQYPDHGVEVLLPLWAPHRRLWRVPVLVRDEPLGPHHLCNTLPNETTA